MIQRLKQWTILKVNKHRPQIDIYLANLGTFQIVAASEHLLGRAEIDSKHVLIVARRFVPLQADVAVLWDEIQAVPDVRKFVRLRASRLRMTLSRVHHYLFVFNAIRIARGHHVRAIHGASDSVLRVAAILWPSASVVLLDEGSSTIATSRRRAHIREMEAERCM